MWFTGNVKESGQASLEYAALTAALLVVVIACAALWRFGSGGGFARVAQGQASHAIEADGGMVDALLY